MEFGERLLKLRKGMNLSQEEAAELLGISRQAISKWESGLATPDTDNIRKLCGLYSVTADFLLFGTEPAEESAEPPSQEKPAFNGQLVKLLWFSAVLAAILLLYYVTNYSR